MNILIAGGAGFIGSNLAHELIRQGHRVTVIDNMITGRKSNVADLVEHQKFALHIGDVADSAFMRQFTETQDRFDRVYHLACPTGVPNIERLGEEMLRACSYGTWNILDLAHAHGARILIVSSSEVYGDPEVFPQSESYSGNVHPHGWRANYEEGKRFTETLAAWYVRSRGVDARTVRLFNVYGPAMSLEDFRVVPRFAGQALSGESLTVHGDGSQRRTFCYVSDLIAGLQLTMEKGQGGEVYNLGGDEETTILDMAHLLLKICNGNGYVAVNERIAFTERPAHDHMSRVPDLTKVRLLGWKQIVSLEDGLRRTVAHFIKNETATKTLERAIPALNEK